MTDREAFKAARDAGLRKRNALRLARAQRHQGDPVTDQDPRSAAAVIGEAARYVNWRPNPTHTPQARYDGLQGLVSTYAYWATVALETLRRVDPGAAERVAWHLTADLDWGLVSENAWEWADAVNEGRPVDPDGRVFPHLTGTKETT